MRMQGRTWVAVFLITLGTIMLIALQRGRDIDSLFWPLALIFIGLWFIFRPSTEWGNMKLRFATDIYRDGDWEIESQEMLAFAHEIDYDLSDASIPPGETVIQLTAFATELSLRLPEEVGLAINATAFVTESKMMGNKQEHIMTGMNYTSPNFAESERKIRFVINSFAVEVKVY